jgi:hypothetical protein
MPPGRWSKKRTFGVAALALLVVVLLYQWLVQFRRPETADLPPLVVAGGVYADLTPAQKQLIDEWLGRISAETGRSVDVPSLYASLTLSARTTFNAVTHALAQTPLSDQSGAPTKLTALDLVAKIVAIAGSIPDAGGDKQFRMYVQLRPDAQKTLESSREFSRQVDNTVYHKGFPICFRGAGGTPSIQFSLAVDGTRGDIDVDYRSSAFPLMLINGHLTASNSDVRAGNNGDRHNGHWAGLMAWWRGFMGLPAVVASAASAPDADGSAATEPRLGVGTKPEDAIRDFLTAWLIERKPGIAVGYLAPRALACLEAERGLPIDRAAARGQIVNAMASVNALLGPLTRLTDAVRGVALSGPRGREINQSYRDAFVMYDVREDLVEALDCENRIHPEQIDAAKARSTAFGKYVGALLQLTPKSGTTGKGETVALIWATENGAWRLVAYDVEPEARPDPLLSQPPDAGPPPAAPETVPGDPALTRAAREFLEAWFVRHDVKAAFRFLAPSAYGCYNVYRPETAPEAASAADAGRLIQERMASLADWAGRPASLGEVLVAAVPHHPDLKVVAHDQAAAFSIITVPDAIAEAVDCTRVNRGDRPAQARPAVPASGRYYAASVRFTQAGPDAAVLWMLWQKTASGWQITAYAVITP